MDRFILSREIVKDIETRLRTAGYHESAMQEAVAAGVAEELRRALAHRAADVLVLAGPGNNGADACAVLRRLTLGAMPEGLKFHLAAWPGQMTQLRRLQESLLPKGGVELRRWLLPESSRELLASLKQESARPLMIVDGIFGAGFERRSPLTWCEDFLAKLMHLARMRGTRVLSIDVPSGLEARGVTAPEFAPLKADVTFAVGGPKPEQLEPEGAERSGRLRLVDLGVAPVAFDVRADARRLRWIPRGAVAAALRTAFAGRDWRTVPLSRTSHKGTRGRVAVVGGSLADGAAPKLAAEAAMRAGAGYAALVEPAYSKISARDLARAAREWVHHAPLKDAAMAEEFLAGFDVVIYGCGMPAGGAKDAGPALEGLERATQRRANKLRLVVVDGGGLVNFVRHRLGRKDVPFRASVVFTPHPKEAADVLKAMGRPVPERRLELFESLRAALTELDLAGAFVLKGAHPLVAALGGASEAWAFDLAEPSLGTAGAGDVFAGLVAAAVLRLDVRAGLAEAALALAQGAQSIGSRAARVGQLAGEMMLPQSEAVRKLSDVLSR